MIEAPAPASSLSVEQALSAAAANGTADIFQRLLNLAEEVGVYARPWKTSIMFTPPGRKNRMLFTVWAKPAKQRIKAYVSSGAVAEFYPTLRVSMNGVS